MIETAMRRGLAAFRYKRNARGARAVLSGFPDALKSSGRAKKKTVMTWFVIAALVAAIPIQSAKSRHINRDAPMPRGMADDSRGRHLVRAARLKPLLPERIFVLRTHRNYC
jgi:hypothetical protein